MQLSSYLHHSNWAGRVWSALTSRSRRLLDLAEIQATCPTFGHHYTGKHTVSLSQIRGSASPARCFDFDVNFRPLRHHNEHRWQGVAAARQSGKKLPPVALIQVGEIYFVEDGHHRISVAKARGEQTIEAEVTVLQLAGSLPWEEVARIA